VTAERYLAAAVTATATTALLIGPIGPVGLVPSAAAAAAPPTVSPTHRNLQITAPPTVSPGNAFTARARHCVGTAFDLMFLDAAGRQSWATYAGGWASIPDVDTQGWANPPPDPQEYEIRFAPPAGARTGAGRVRIGCSQSVTPAGGDSVPVTIKVVAR
jgi:hypothetical protein